MLKNTAFKNYRIEAIAYDSGFKSKASFNRVFKNITGITPSEFKKTNK
jgi:AraC-like DNA-binding protein